MATLAFAFLSDSDSSLDNPISRTQEILPHTGGDSAGDIPNRKIKTNFLYIIVCSMGNT